MVVAQAVGRNPDGADAGRYRTLGIRDAPIVSEQSRHANIAEKEQSRNR